MFGIRRRSFSVSPFPCCPSCCPLALEPRNVVRSYVGFLAASGVERSSVPDSAPSACVKTRRSSRRLKPANGSPQIFESFDFYGAPGQIRTADLLVRSQTLYPTELRAREVHYSRGPARSRFSAAMIRPSLSRRKRRSRHSTVSPNKAAAHTATPQRSRAGIK
jgi:hypothetical protein